MSVQHFILAPYDVVYLRWEGDVSRSDVEQLRRDLLAEGDFTPSSPQLIDVRNGNLGNLSAADNRHLAETTITDAGVKQAFVSPSDVNYGMARMYAVLAAGRQVQVFRSMEEACAWLGVPVEDLPDSE